MLQVVRVPFRKIKIKKKLEEFLSACCSARLRSFIKACMWEPGACRRYMLGQIRGELMAVVSRMLHRKIK